jgi:glycosyltransferase involved in cell wall biosynthesis
LPIPDDAAPRDAGPDTPLSEQERLLEHQLRYFYDEVLQLRKERFEIVYTASWLVVHPLLRLEEALVGLGRRFFGRGETRRAPAAAALPASDPAQSVASRRLLIDVTGTIARDMGTGIERVTKDLSRALLAADPARCLLVRCDRGRLLACPSAFETPFHAGDRDVTIEPGDRLLILADAWNYPELYDGACDAMRRGGGRIVVCVHDVIPALYPAACHERTSTLFRPWLDDVVRNADGVLTVSRASLDDLLGFICEHELPHRPGLSLAWFHNASRFDPKADAVASERAKKLFADGAPVFLCVGTFEPRKGQKVAIEAFERLWAQGKEWRLVFIGRRGWFDHALAARVGEHPQFDRKLFWFDDVDDAELSYFYAHISALVFPSFAEGFGLPVIEAARFGKPVICSDIPVFREIGRDGAIYFAANDPDALVARLLDWETGRVEAHPERIVHSTWGDAANRILDAVLNERWDVRLPGAETAP